MLPVQFQVCEIVIFRHVQIIHDRFQLYTVILTLLPPHPQRVYVLLQ